MDDFTSRWNGGAYQQRFGAGHMALIAIRIASPGRWNQYQYLHSRLVDEHLDTDLCALYACMPRSSSPREAYEARPDSVSWLTSFEGRVRDNLAARRQSWSMTTPAGMPSEDRPPNRTVGGARH